MPLIRSLFVVLFAGVCLPLLAQPRVQYNVPFGTFLEDVVFADSNTVCFSGSNLFLISLDGTRTISGLSSGGISVQAVHFPSHNFGMAIGGNGSYRTNDRCSYQLGWSNNQSVGVSQDLRDVHFSDDDHGWVVGEVGTLVRTTDQTTSWTTIPTGLTSHLSGVYALNDSVAIACGDGGQVLRSLHNQVTSTQTIGSGVDWAKIYFADAQNGFIVGTGGAVSRTTDQGATWAPITLPTGADLRAVQFSTPQHGAVAGDSGRVFVTTDGGGTWQAGTLALGDPIKAIAWRNDREGYLVGRKPGSPAFVCQTFDGGLNWTRLNGELKRLDFPTPEVGYAVGFFGVSLKTTDGGNHWNPTNLQTLQYLNDVQFLNPDTGFVAGGGFIYRTLDGGDNWTTLSPGGSSLYAVHFSDFDHGIATGYAGTRTYTTNAGATWTTTTTGGNLWHLDLAFTSHLVGYHASSNGGISKTTDGGQTWNFTPTNNTNQLGDVHFVDAHYGWAVGASGTILHTTDAGSSWTTQNSGTTEYLDGIHFFNQDTGMVVGYGGKYLLTEDGGATWTDYAVQNVDFTDVVYPTPERGYLVAGGGIFVQGELILNSSFRAPYCPGEQLILGILRPVYNNDDSISVVFEVAGEAESFANPRLADTVRFDSMVWVNVTVPDTFSEGLYKCRARHLNAPFQVSTTRYFKTVRKLEVTFSLVDSLLIAQSSLPNTQINWLRIDDVGNVQFVSSGDTIQPTIPGPYFISASTGCCDFTSDQLRLDTCNGKIYQPRQEQMLNLCAGESITIGSQVYSQAGTYLDTLTTAVGCDSILETTIQMLPASNSADSLSICDGDSAFLSGTWQTNAGTYFDTLTNALGCDSVIGTALRVLPNYRTEDSLALCDGDSVFLAGAWQTTDGMYVDSLLTTNGCDSLEATWLTFQSVNAGLSQSGDTLTADLAGATYQWLDCQNGSAPIAGANGQSFVPPQTGSYAVQVTENGCTGLSACQPVVIIGVEGHLDGTFFLYPNPTQGECTIDGPAHQSGAVRIYDVTGKPVWQGMWTGERMSVDLSDVAPGLYGVEIRTGQGSWTEKVWVK